MAPPENNPPSQRILPLVYKKNVAVLQGHINKQWSGIELEPWLRNLETTSEVERIEEDEAKIQEALSFIDYQKGSARKMAEFITASTWSDFKKEIHRILGVRVPDPNKDNVEIGTLKWDKTETFLEFAHNMKQILDRRTQAGDLSASATQMLYNFAESNIRHQMPRNLEEKVKKMPTTSKDKATFAEFIMMCQDLLTESDHEGLKCNTIRHGNDTENMSGMYSRRGGKRYRGSCNSVQTQHRSVENTNYVKRLNERDFENAIRWEQRNKLCSRCLCPGHQRSTCRGTRRCSYCNKMGHEYAECYHIKRKPNFNQNSRNSEQQNSRFNQPDSRRNQYGNYQRKQYYQSNRGRAPYNQQGY